VNWEEHLSERLETKYCSSGINWSDVKVHELPGIIRDGEEAGALLKACGSYGPQHLRAWREHRKMTQEAVAEAVGITHQQIGRIERRLQPYSQELLETLAKLYQTTPAFLIEVHPDDADRVRAIWDYSNFIQPKRQQ
jgi:DNA-binding XRE family transcriptional regulator